MPLTLDGAKKIAGLLVNYSHNTYQKGYKDVDINDLKKGRAVLEMGEISKYIKYVREKRYPLTLKTGDMKSKNSTVIVTNLTDVGDKEWKPHIQLLVHTGESDTTYMGGLYEPFLEYKSAVMKYESFSDPKWDPLKAKAAKKVKKYRYDTDLKNELNKAMWDNLENKSKSGDLKRKRGRSMDIGGKDLKDAPKLKKLKKRANEIMKEKAFKNLKLEDWAIIEDWKKQQIDTFIRNVAYLAEGVRCPTMLTVTRVILWTCSQIKIRKNSGTLWKTKDTKNTKILRGIYSALQSLPQSKSGSSQALNYWWYGAEPKKGEPKKAYDELLDMINNAMVAYVWLYYTLFENNGIYKDVKGTGKYKQPDVMMKMLLYRDHISPFLKMEPEESELKNIDCKNALKPFTLI